MHSLRRESEKTIGKAEQGRKVEGCSESPNEDAPGQAQSDTIAGSVRKEQLRRRTDSAIGAVTSCSFAWAE